MEGNLTPDRIETLLAHREWVRRVALALTADEGAAGDLEQDLWCEVLERPPQPRRSIRGWLAAALRRDLFDHRKAETRRRRREETVARPEAAPATANLVAEADAHRRVVQAVLGLQEPYRTAVLLRWFEDLKPAEIARQQGIPVDTVRTRLRRAMDMLRARLVEEAGGDRRTFLAGLFPLARRAAREEVLAGIGTAGVLGGILMATKAKAAIASVAVVLAAFLAWQLIPGSGDGAGSRETGHQPTTSMGTAVVTVVTPRPKHGAGAAVDDASGVRRLILRGRIEGLVSGESIPARISVLPLFEGEEVPREPLHVEASPEGRFEVDLSTVLAAAPRPETRVALAVLVDHPAYLPVGIRVDVPRAAAADPEGTTVLEAVVTVRPAAVLLVRVTDEAGNSVPGAKVAPFVRSGDIPAEFPLDRAVTDAAGTTRLRLDPGKSQLVVASRPGMAPAARVVKGGEPGTAHLVLRAGVVIEGRVTERGIPLEGARLLVYPSSQEGHWLHMEWMDRVEEKVYWEGGAVRADDLPVSSGPDGKYRATGLCEGKWRVRVESLGLDRRPMGFERFVEAPAEGVDFEVATGRVVAEVRSGGRPVAGVRIGAFVGGSAPMVVTDAEGRAVMDLVPGTEFSMQTECKGFREARPEGKSPEAGATVVLPIVLEPLPPRGRLAVVVRDATGKPVPLAGLAFFEPGSSKPWPKETRYRMESGEGRFVVDDMEPGQWRLVVRPGRDWDPDFTWDGDEGTWFDEAFDVEIPISGEKEVIVAARRGGRLRIAARDGKGEILPALCEIRDSTDSVLKPLIATRHGSGAHSFGEGCLGTNDPSDVAEVLPPGKYRLRFSLEGFDEKTIETEVEVGRTRAVDVVLEGNGEPRRDPPVMAPANR